MRRSLRHAWVGAVVALTFAGCAASPGAEPHPVDPDALAHIAAPRMVVGQGMVLETAGTPPQLCLGGTMESYPPQCAGGVPLDGWDWAGVDESGSASGSTWGEYAVWGTWDGSTLTVDTVALLSLYDPPPLEVPQLDPANAGDTPEAELLEIQAGLFDAEPYPVLGSWPENGYLFVSVIYDDGRIQAWLDARYGPEKLVALGALRDVDPG